MGINNLGILIKYKSPSSITYKNHEYFKGMKIGFDTSIYIYKYVTAIRGSGYDLTTKDGKLISHIYGIWSKILSNLKNGIESVWIFDGEPPNIKQNIIKSRRKKKHVAKHKLQTGCFKDEYERQILSKSSFNIKNEHIADISKLLSLIGIPFIQSIGEAEAQCVALNKAGKIDGIASEDWDVLALGGKLLLKDFTGKKLVKSINRDALLGDLDLTYEQFIELCIIMGTDYCSGIGNLGPVKAYEEYINCGKSIEKLVKCFKKRGRYKIPHNFLEQAEIIKNYYINVDVLDPCDPAIDYTWKKPDRDGLEEYLIDELGMNRERTLQNINMIMKIYEEYRLNNKLSGGFRVNNYNKFKLKLGNTDIDIDDIEDRYSINIKELSEPPRY